MGVFILKIHLHELSDCIAFCSKSQIYNSPIENRIQNVIYKTVENLVFIIECRFFCFHFNTFLTMFEFIRVIK